MPIEKDYMITAADRRCLEMLKSFVPDRIFDMHMHAYDVKYMPHLTQDPGSVFNPPDGGALDFDSYMKYQGPLYGAGKEIWGNCLLVPDPAMGEAGSTLREESVDALVRELEKNERLFGAVPAIPGDSGETLDSLIRHERIRGFKVYHFFAKTRPSFDADLYEYIPETAWEVANERGMFITVHMVKQKALADDSNRAYIKEMCRKYPNARLILAHGARSFAAWTAIETIRELKPCHNAYVDISALCEPQAIVEIIRELGLKRVFWGSDYPVSMQRGKCVSVADAFIWLDKNTLITDRSLTDCELALVGVEELLAVRQACHILGLSGKEIEDLFFHNAMRMLTDSGA
jgi:glutamate-1-semialdehyde 2,1-aminomutase